MNFQIQDIEKYTILKSFIITISNLNTDGGACLESNILDNQFKCCFNDNLQTINICEGANLFAIKNIFDYISSLGYENLSFNPSKISHYNSNLLKLNKDCMLLNNRKIFNLILDKVRLN